MIPKAASASLLLLAAACGSPPPSLAAAERELERATAADGARFVEVPGDFDVTPGHAELPATGQPKLHFLVAGDAGTGNLRQRTVGRSMAAVCDRTPCDWVLYLGDNIHPGGLPEDRFEQLRLRDERFVRPYGAMSAPFFAIVGERDYGLDGRAAASRQLEQHWPPSLGPRFRMPALRYDLHVGDVAHLVGLDTTAALWKDGAAQGAWARSVLGGTTARWKIAFGHHSAQMNDEGLRAVYRDGVCPVADVVFTGHEQALDLTPPGDDCGAAVVRSGAAGRGGGPLGFIGVTLDGDEMQVTRYTLEDPCCRLSVPDQCLTMQVDLTLPVAAAAWCRVKGDPSWKAGACR